MEREFWGPFTDWINSIVYGRDHAIDAEDMNIYKIVDSAEEAMEIIRKSPERHFVLGLRRPQPRHFMPHLTALCGPVYL